MTRRIVIVLAAVMALVLPATAASAAATWTRSATPNRGTIASVLQDVTMVPGTSTAWAVGYYYDNNVAAYRTMTQRYTGTSWGIVSSPNPSGNGYSQLNKVDATAADNVWAVGYDSQTGTLVERYNGSQWSTVAPPSGISVRGLDVVSSTNVWVAGYSGSTGTISQWTGSGWVSRYTLPPIPGRHLAVFEGIAVGPNGDVWAVGYYTSPSSGLLEPWLVQWTGTASTGAAPDLGTSATLWGVAATSGGNLWAVGYTAPPSGGNATLALRGSGG
jgi:hypothetical protein